MTWRQMIGVGVRNVVLARGELDRLEGPGYAARDRVCDEERSERGIRVIRSLPPKRKFWPLESIELSSRKDDSSDAHYQTRHC